MNQIIKIKYNTKRDVREEYFIEKNGTINNINGRLK